MDSGMADGEDGEGGNRVRVSGGAALGWEGRGGKGRGRKIGQAGVEEIGSSRAYTSTGRGRYTLEQPWKGTPGLRCKRPISSLRSQQQG
jgi:hypothetical protein